MLKENPTLSYQKVFKKMVKYISLDIVLGHKWQQIIVSKDALRYSKFNQ